VKKGCAIWLPTFVQRDIHFFGEQPKVCWRRKVVSWNNSVLFDRIHPPIIGRRVAVVEDDLREWSSFDLRIRRFEVRILSDALFSRISLPYIAFSCRVECEGDNGASGE
jgi:hypothetical protein